ncbi:uncharacterized protein PHACADRAFT_203316 [Phanerochaete carnosa HHB-10118-sp]|uniref:CCHC-type domain-containing protein n=1 Tax=Phanerochaete carnosa (strain HHB-10118-sp) TaxID=650164 RepID=K5WCY6_PHACS|nr:uncharacterized protein PHACADRAFT_203316 [Phanerochaete carnosa HHB-10118-sp]EKM48052.1 hypothetical protein PHACADRAFT_203316 [Phanerochaete carnosa HHB-10118-sp]
MCLLTALSNSFSNVVEPILTVTKPDDLKLDDICNRLLDKANCRGTNVATFYAPNTKAFSLSAPKLGKTKKKCNFCGYKGHVKKDCRKKKAAAQKAKKASGKSENRKSNLSGNSTGFTSYNSGVNRWMLNSSCM